jgi:hypothetical protein
MIWVQVKIFIDGSWESKGGDDMQTRSWYKICDGNECYELEGEDQKLFPKCLDVFEREKTIKLLRKKFEELKNGKETSINFHGKLDEEQ